MQVHDVSSATTAYTVVPYALFAMVQETKPFNNGAIGFGNNQRSTITLIPNPKAMKRQFRKRNFNAGILSAQFQLEERVGLPGSRSM
jgi:hypothetical protein